MSIPRSGPRRQTLGQSVAGQILDQLREGTLRVGDRLPSLVDLAEGYGVGRNVMREAVQQLVALGVVDVRPKRGIVITGTGVDAALDALAVGAILDDRTVKELYDFRMLVETAIADQAAREATPTQIESLESALSLFNEAVTMGSGVYLRDIAFHEELAKASNNVVYFRVVEALRDLLETSRRRTDSAPGAPEEAQQQHRAILDAIVARDPERARATMKKHIETAWRRVEETSARAPVV